MTVYPSRSDHKYRHDSNYDHIISKSPEELAEWISTIADCVACEMIHSAECRYHLHQEGKSCYQCWLDWLNTEAERK